jgi:hypothetical protein
MSRREQKLRAAARREAFIAEPRVERLVAALGMGVRFNRSHWHGTPIPHWIFESPGGRQLLHYWPSSGRFWRPADNDKGTCDEHLEAVELARMTLARKPI